MKKYVVYCAFFILFSFGSIDIVIKENPKATRIIVASQKSILVATAIVFGATFIGRCRD